MRIGDALRGLFGKSRHKAPETERMMLSRRELGGTALALLAGAAAEKPLPIAPAAPPLPVAPSLVRGVSGVGEYFSGASGIGEYFSGTVHAVHWRDWYKP